MNRILNLVLTAVLAGPFCLDPLFPGPVGAQEEEAEFDLVSEFSGSDAPDRATEGKSCDCCGPQWRIRGGALFMQRGTPDASLLIFDVADPTNDLVGNELNFDFETGWEVSAIRDCTDRGWEIRFMSIDGWEAASLLTAVPATDFQINTAPPSFLPGTTIADTTYRSQLLSGEVNRRWRYRDNVTVFAGFRIFELDEHLRVDTDTAVFPSSYDVSTANRLYGGQLGLEAKLFCRDRVTVEGVGKLGVYYNDSGQSSVLDTGVVDFTAAVTDERAVFAAELGVTAAYCLTDSLSLRASYNVMLFDSVVLASDQIPVTNIVFGTGISHDDVFYHGAMVGLEYRR